MQGKRLVTFLLVAAALYFSWLWINRYFQQKHPDWYVDQPPHQTEAQNQTAQASTNPSTQVATTQPGAIYAVGGQPKAIEIGSSKFDKDGKLSDYAIGLAIDPQGAAISSATLNRLRAAVGKDEPYVFQKPYKDLDPASSRSLVTQGIHINGKRVDLYNVNWSLAESNEKSGSVLKSATYSVDIAQPDGKKLARISKTYTLRPAKDESFGYELSMVYLYENLSAQPLVIKTFFNGPVVPTPENNRDIPEVVAGYNDQKQVALKHHPASSLEPDKDPWDIVAQEKLPLLWTGWTSAYFDSIVKPDTDPSASIFANAKAKALAKRTEDGQDFTAISFETADLTVSPGQTSSLPFDVYLGPRQRSILNSDYYAQFPRGYNLTLVLTGGFCGFCTFEPLIALMVTLLGFFFKITHDWGLAIICLVIIVRLILHPVTKRSQLSMAKLGKFGPEIKHIQDKYKDDKEALNREMANFMKEHGVAQASQALWGCLPMLLQMPIWIALWSSLQSTFELRHASFLWGFTWIKDLSQPDRLIYFPNNFRLWWFHLDAINILPILMAVVFYIQQKMTPKPPTMTEEQAMQYKMMQWMSLLFPIFLYTGPSGLNLYILTSTSIGIIESKRIRDHIKEREEAEKGGKIIVDAKPTRASKKLDRNDPQQPKKKGGFMGFLADLQKKAEELQREADRHKRKS
ncbi:MAG TPA: YidC/Oxa1 family insertase periplasmic-domain containing protein [Tepidisphaeraceae bacterium]|nr:YidC/Oxa1 family insertase periplasmic-domain containing protein [Tepidisphaeraceae bacterium]